MNVSEFNVFPDSMKVQTSAIQAAIDKCAESGGGIVEFSSGIYRTGTLYLRNGVHLMLPYGCILRGADDFDDYNRSDAWSENWIYPPEKNNGAHLIVAYHVNYCGIFGGGVIDGNGDHWGYRQDSDFRRPSQMLYFCGAFNVTLSDLQLRNSPYWNCYVYDCEDVIISRLRIRSDVGIPNRDGIDIDASRRVLISDCIINTEDDCITFRCCNQFLKDRSHVLEDVAVTNCQLSTKGCNAFRIGVGCGAIRNCNVSNVVIRNSSKGVCIESRYAVFNSDEEPGCTIESIRFSNIYMECRNPVFIASHCLGLNEMYAPPIRDVSFSNMTVHAQHHFVVEANVGSVVEDISFSQIRVVFDRRAERYVDKCGYAEWEYFSSPYAFYVANARNLRICDVEVCVRGEGIGIRQLLKNHNAENCLIRDSEITVEAT